MTADVHLLVSRFELCLLKLSNLLQQLSEEMAVCYHMKATSSYQLFYILCSHIHI